jgi:low affinity Fe/Cu permease
MGQKNADRGKPQSISDWFAQFAKHASSAVGSPRAFIAAAAVIAAWAIAGPVMGFSDEWQLIANTITNVVTFLIVFLIQNSQNRDSRALHLKLDELIRSLREAHNELIDIENVTDEELQALAHHYERIRAEYEHRQLGGDTRNEAA